MNQSYLLDKKTAEEAYLTVEKSIRDFLQTERSWRDGLHVIVMDPRAKCGEIPFEEAILFERSINPDKWDVDLKTLARKKAKVSWEHGMDSQAVQQFRPYLYEKGDNKYAGAVVHHGLVVSVAAIQWYFDELFSVWIAAACRALAIEKMEKILNTANRHFVE
jgi:hypothetical protein